MIIRVLILGTLADVSLGISSNVKIQFKSTARSFLLLLLKLLWRYLRKRSLIQLLSPSIHKCWDFCVYLRSLKCFLNFFVVTGST